VPFSGLQRLIFGRDRCERRLDPVGEARGAIVLVHLGGGVGRSLFSRRDRWLKGARSGDVAGRGGGVGEARAEAARNARKARTCSIMASGAMNQGM
jgi:hypothetical protein